MKLGRSGHWGRAAAANMALVMLASTLCACAPLLVGGAAVTTALLAVDRRTTGAQLDDQAIEWRIADFVRLQVGQKANVAVTSYNRQVLLSGEVATEQDKALIGRHAAGVDNVRHVVNELAVLGSASLIQGSSDALVTARVKAALMDAPELSASAVKVVTARGTAYLMGRLTQREIDKTTEITRNTQGVQRVVRLFETISEEELARLRPKPAPVTKTAPSEK